MMSATTTDHTTALAAAAGSVEKRDYVRQIFSQIAPRYDLLNRVLSFNIDRRWRKAAIEELDIDGRNGVFVDLCAGTLDVSAQLVRTSGFRGYILGADFAEPMLRAGKGKARGTPIAPVVADAVLLPVADSSLEGAIVAFGIRNVADLGAALTEASRVLKPRARMVILEFSTPRFAPVRWIYHLYFHFILPLIGGIVSGHSTAYRYLPRSVANFPVEEDLAGRMRAAGFVDVRWRSLTFGIAAIHRGERAA